MNNSIIDDENIINSRFLPEEDIIEILGEDALLDTELAPDDDDVDGLFDLVKEDDPRYDINPIHYRRPSHLFIEPLYERQPGETVKDYQKFLVYASLHVENRTVVAAWEAWKGDKGSTNLSKNPPGNFRDVAKHWRWEERSYVLDLQRNKVTQKIWIDRDLQRREADWSVANTLRDKATEALEGYDADTLSANSIARFLELSSALQEKAIPNTNLAADELSSLLSAMPEERRGRIIEIAIARIRQE